MQDKEEQIYHVLARVQAGIGGFIALLFFSLYRYTPEVLSNLQSAQVVMFLGVLSLLYHFTIHLWLRQRYLSASTLIQTILTGSNLFLIISVTGGLESPYYFLWLLMIISLAALGFRYTVAVVAGTLLYYFYETYQTFSSHGGFISENINESLVQMLMSIITAILSQWIFHSIRSAHKSNNSFADQAREESIKASSVMESMGDGVVVIDREGKITYLNPAAEQLIGWEESNAVSLNWRPVMNLKTSDDHEIDDKHDPFMEAWRQNRSIVRNNLVMITRSGHRRDLTMSVSPIYNSASQFTGAIAVFRDVSEEKAVERQRSEFISTASHEMRTPVAAIEGYLSLALNPKVASVDERAKGFLLKAHDATQHLGELFRDLLSITKLEEGKMHLKKEPVNLTQVIQDTITNLQPIADQKGLKLAFEPDTPVGSSARKVLNPQYSVLGDPARLREVMTNLIDNAIKFTAQGSVTVSISGSDDLVTVKVKDTGIGIGKEDAAHLFQKFYRIDNSATRTIGGTGLGLYLTRSIVELYGGRIWVESEPGEGTTFMFNLPRLKSAALKPVEPDKIVHPSAGRSFDSIRKPLTPAAHVKTALRV